MLRFSNVLGRGHRHPDHPGARPAAGAVRSSGTTPGVQFVHEIDVVRAIMFVLDHDLDGIFNVAGDGLLPWSEVAAMCGKRLAPLPPVGRSLAAAAALARLGVDLPPELLDLLTYGRGVDNRRLRSQGFDVPLHVGRGGAGVRRGRPPARARSAVPTRLPLRARRRAVLPPLARGGAGPPDSVRRWSTSARARSAGCRGRSRWRGRRGSSSTSCRAGWRRRRCSVKSMARPRSCIDEPGRAVGRITLRRRHLVDGVVRRAAVLLAQVDLPLGAAPPAAGAQRHALRGGQVEQGLHVARDRARHLDRARRTDR